jgi:hypothetical protein
MKMRRIYNFKAKMMVNQSVLGLRKSINFNMQLHMTLQAPLSRLSSVSLIKVANLILSVIFLRI